MAGREYMQDADIRCAAAVVLLRAQIRNQAHKSLGAGPAPPNPFSHGNWRRNLLYVLCRPPGYSWLDFHAVATEDKRQVNPGLVQDGWRGDAAAVAMEEGRAAGKQ